MKVGIAGQFILFTMLSASTGARAGERYQFYNGIRSMGMGGAAAAVVNDETALLYNPAALGKLRDHFITLVDPEIELGSQTQPVVGTNPVLAMDPQKTLDKASAHQDKHLHERAQVFPSIVIPNFGFGVFGKYTVDAQVDSATGKFEYDYTNDYAGVLGTNVRLFNGIVKVGANARMVNRTEVRRDDIDTSSTSLTLSGLASSGVGLASDAGLILTAPIALLPTLAVVYHDIGRTSYTLRDGLFMKTADKPDSTPSTVDGALSVSPILGNRARSTWTVEYKDALNVYKEKDVMRRVHAGVEFNVADALFLRGGMNQRYWTAGLEFDMMNYQFQFASYGEDIGADQSPKEDRRYEVKFAFRF